MANRHTRKEQKAKKIDPTTATIIVAIIGLIGVLLTAALNPQLLDRFGDIFKPKCPFQGADDSTTIVNLINAEADAANHGDFNAIKIIFDPNARIRDRVNDQIPSEKKQEWVSPEAYYYETLFASTKITSAVHSNIKSVGPNPISTEAWFTSASSGYANGTKYDNPPGSDHWHFMKKNGCWTIADFDFNASHIPFPP